LCTWLRVAATRELDGRGEPSERLRVSVDDGSDGLFGRLAVHLRFITLDQLAAATAQQGREAEPRPLGQILVETAGLTQEQIDAVLRQQETVLRVRAEAEASAARAAARNARAAPAPTLSQVISGKKLDAAIAADDARAAADAGRTTQRALSALHDTVSKPWNPATLKDATPHAAPNVAPPNVAPPNVAPPSVAPPSVAPPDASPQPTSRPSATSPATARGAREGHVVAPASSNVGFAPPSTGGAGTAPSVPSAPNAPASSPTTGVFSAPVLTGVAAAEHAARVLRWSSGIDTTLARQWMERMLAAAVAESASDMHFHAEERVRMRLHGDLITVSDKASPNAVLRAAFAALLPADELARLDAVGEVDSALTIDGVGRFRASVYQTARGVDGVFRVVKTTPPTLTSLGLPSALARLTTFHQGIVLCTGPAGSGKTSTMAALVAMINEERAEHVVSIEDPIEVVHKSLRCIVNQRQAGKHTGGFERALKAALREDPDVIVIGEMRDRETASLALTAAETGHLVLATLHTHSAVRTINRVIGEFAPQQQATIRAMLSESLRAVVSQRLLKRRDGRGVVPAVEVLYCTPAVANLIRDNRTHQIRSAMQTGTVHGMQTLDAALNDLVARRIVARADAIMQAEDPKAIDEVDDDDDDVEVTDGVAGAEGAEGAQGTARVQGAEDADGTDGADGSGGAGNGAGRASGGVR
jgi:twitching motility protein PilT